MNDRFAKLKAAQQKVCDLGSLVLNARDRLHRLEVEVSAAKTDVHQAEKNLVDARAEVEKEERALGLLRSVAP